MTLRLTPIEYQTLVRSLFIAKTVVECAELEEDQATHDVMALIEVVHAAAPSFGAEAMFNGNPAMGAPLVDFEEATILSIIDWYDDASFWDTLEERLSLRDIAEERSQAQWEWLPDDQKNRILNKHLEYYYEEFAEHGIQNLRLVPPDPKKPAATPWSAFSDPADSALNGNAENKIIEFPGKRPRKPEDS